MKNTLTLTATALALAFSAGAANAAANSGATLGPISVTLIDLNPLDSVAPSITWNTTYYGYGDYASANAYDTAASNYQGSGLWGSNQFSTISFSSSTALSSASAGITSGADVTKAGGASAAASGHANGTTSAGNYSSYSANAYAPYYYYNAFSLSANTAVVFSASASASATTTVGYQTGWGSEYATATAYVQAWGSQPSGSGGSQSSYSQVSAYASYGGTYAWNNQTQQYDYIYSGQSQSDSGTVGVVFTNLTSGAKDGYFQAYAYANGYSYVQAVPEPGSYAMLLAGLGLMGAVARRRSRG